MNQQRPYLAYLLRLWQESAGDAPGGDPPGGDLPHGEPPIWRASLQSPHSDERLGFASLADLFGFLENETGSSPPNSERADKEERR